ncbi:MAG TPA: acyl carrier protein [Polyangiaceae bacterium]|nr:acyl carrier protein [Polyangiaceae bacterium]
MATAQPSGIDRDTVLSALHDHVVQEILFLDEPLAKDDDLFDAGFDSMSLARVLVFVEERFGVSIPDEAVVVDEVSTLETMTTFVLGYLEPA